MAVRQVGRIRKHPSLIVLRNASLTLSACHDGDA